MKHRNKKGKCSNAEAAMRSINYGRNIKRVVTLKKEIVLNEKRRKGCVEDGSTTVESSL